MYSLKQQNAGAPKKRIGYLVRRPINYLI